VGIRNTIINSRLKLSPTPTSVSSLMPVPAAPTQLLIPANRIGSKLEPLKGEECDVSVTPELQPLDRSCGAISKAAAAEMPKELETLVSEDVEDYDVHGFTHGFTRGNPGFVPQRLCLPPCFVDEDDIPPHTDTLEERPPSFWPFPVDGGGQPLPSQRVEPVSRVQIDNSCKAAMLEGQNMGSPAVDGHSLPSLSTADSRTEIPLLPGPCRRCQLHRSSAPFRNSNLVAEDN